MATRERNRLARAGGVLLTLSGALAIGGLLVAALAPSGANSAGAADLLLLASIPCALAAILVLPGAPDHPSGAARTLVDGLIVGGSALLVAWGADLSDHSPALGHPAAPAWLAHAVGLIVVAGAAVVIATRAQPAARPSFVLAAAGLGSMAVADAYWLHERLIGAEAPVAALAVAGALGATLLALALRHSRTAVGGEKPGLPTRASVFVPSVPLAAALVVVAAEAASGAPFDPFIAWGAGALALLIVARQVLALVENISFWRNLEAEVEARNDELRRREARFRSLVQNSSDVITAVQPDGRVRYQSPSVERILGHPAAEIEARGLSALIVGDDLPGLLEALGEIADEPGATRVLECRVRHGQGTPRHAEVVATNLLEDPDVGAYVLNVRDITERKALEEQLTHLAFHDPLTDLANRALFRDRLVHALKRSERKKGEVAVLFCDLDDFKTVNDTLGHGYGDELLVAVGRLLKESLGPGDTVARLGGDEFAILLEDIEDELEPPRIGERILDSFDQALDAAGRKVFVRASIGIAMTPSSGKTAEDLLRSADIAMYTAKAQGKGMYELFESGMREAIAGRMQLEGDLRRALDRDEISLTYQPIVSLATGRLRAVEALLRWQHPDRGWIPPAEFVPLAERNGMIGILGEWALETACRQARRWQERHRGSPPLSISVNLSARQLQAYEFPATVMRILRESRLHPSSLMLEVTESVLIDDEEKIERLRELRGLGVGVAIDDFGTGYSSLAYLRRFPVSALKIDRSFLAGLDEGSSESALTKAIVTMAHTLGLTAIAEGIEDPHQLAELRAMGCELGQGYHFAPPLTAREFEPLLARDLPLPHRRAAGSTTTERPRPRVGHRSRSSARPATSR